MGDILKLSCPCGYSKELFTGVGLASCSIQMVNSVFPEDKRAEFDKYYGSNEVKSFYVANEPSFCAHCKEIMAVSVIKAQLVNDKTIKIVNDCPTCGHAVELLSTPYHCPLCSKELIRERVGRWD